MLGHFKLNVEDYTTAVPYGSESQFDIQVPIMGYIRYYFAV